MNVENPNPTEIAEILKKFKTIAVIGMSKNPEKDAYRIPEFLIRNGYNVIPVNPTGEEILGRRSYKKLSDVTEKIEIVDVFRPSEDVPNYVDEVIKAKPNVFWEQLGIHSPEAEEKIAAAGIRVVYDRCMKVELAKIRS